MNARVLTASAAAALAGRLGTSGAGTLALAIDEPPADAAEAFAKAVVRLGGAASYGERKLVISAGRDVLVALRHEPGGSCGPLAVEALRAVDAAGALPLKLRLRSGDLSFHDGAKVMGILNVTSDSFYDGGAYRRMDAARAHAARMVEAGAALIDIGGQSYAAGTAAVDEAEERARVVPVVEALVRDGLGVPLSIDTYKSAVADAALAAGADLINDCSGLRDERLAAVIARNDAGLVIMHLRGELGIRGAFFEYDDAIGEILAFLRVRLERARAAGVAAESLVIDPGLEFGKEPATDLEILAQFGDLRSLGAPLLLAASRKSFLGAIFGRSAPELLVPSLAAAAIGIAAGARLVRAHDVAETVALAKMLAVVEAAGPKATAAPLGRLT